jgi:hypothetical protein
MRVAFNCERTTIISQLFGVKGSAIPDDMQNHAPINTSTLKLSATNEKSKLRFDVVNGS